MNTDQARAAVVAALATVAPEADLTEVPPGARMRDELDLDSMHLLQRLHDDTGVEVPEAAYAQVETLEGLLAYLTAA